MLKVPDSVHSVRNKSSISFYDSRCNTSWGEFMGKMFLSFSKCRGVVMEAAFVQTTTTLRLILALRSVRKKVLRRGRALATQLAPTLFRSCGTNIHLLWYTSMSRHVRRATVTSERRFSWHGPNSWSEFTKHWSVHCSFTMQLLTTTVNATCLASCVLYIELTLLFSGCAPQTQLFCLTTNTPREIDHGKFAFEETTYSDDVHRMLP